MFNSTRLATTACSMLEREGVTGFLGVKDLCVTNR